MTDELDGISAKAKNKKKNKSLIIFVLNTNTLVFELFRND